MALTKQERRLTIKRRIKKKITGTKDKPRMTIFRSNKQIYVQFVNDLESKTFLSASSKEKEIADKGNMKKIDQAKQVGELAAKKALEKGIKEVVFDRNGYLYHGRVKALADAARKGGLKF